MLKSNPPVQAKKLGAVDFLLRGMIITFYTTAVIIFTGLMAYLVMLNDPRLMTKFGFVSEATIPSSNTTSVEAAEKVAAEMGMSDVQIVVTDDSRNCALWETSGPGSVVLKQKFSSDGESPLQGGCFSSDTPDTVYISTGLGSGTMLRTITLHELSHVLQWRGDVESNIKSDAESVRKNECLADANVYRIDPNLERYLPYFSEGKCADMQDLLD